MTEDSLALVSAETIPAVIGGADTIDSVEHELTPVYAQPVGLTLPEGIQEDDLDVETTSPKKNDAVVETPSTTAATPTSMATPKPLPEPERTGATPCRAPEQTGTVGGTSTPPMTPTVLEVSTPGSTLPGLDLDETPKPNPELLRITEAAIDARLRRIFQPSKRTGEYKVSDAILAQYKKPGKSRKSLQKLFETCGYDKAGLEEQWT